MWKGISGKNCQQDEMLLDLDWCHFSWFSSSDKESCDPSIKNNVFMSASSSAKVLQFSPAFDYLHWTLFTLGPKIGIVVQKVQNQNWARVIRKIFYGLFRYLKLVLGTWNQKLIQNTWSIEAKIFQEILEIQASFKVRFLRRNDEMTRLKIF